MFNRKLHVNYRKFVRYSFYVVLSQYYDYEHIEHVHPTTLGKYRLLEGKDGVVGYEQIWPRGLFGQARSIVEQRFIAPNEMWFEFKEGRHKGTQVHTFLYEEEGGTMVDETYIMNLPDWKWLGVLVKPFVVRQVDRIWDEDTDVEVCHDGWPGIPEEAKLEKAAESVRESAVESLSDVPVGEARVVLVDGVEVAVFNRDGELYAVDNRCPHTGGPLVLGAVEGHEVVCPWHGARFDLSDGRLVCGPGEDGVRGYAVQLVDGKIEVDVS